MFRCPNCSMTFHTLRDLLTHFVHEEECRIKAYIDCLCKVGGFDASIMVFETGLGEVDKWL